MPINNKTFLIRGNIIKKLTEKIEEATMNEVVQAIENQKTKQTVQIKPQIFELLKKEIGDFEIII